MTETKPPSIAHRPTPAAKTQVVPTHCDSRVLLGGARELLIQHGGETYRLRETRQRKLILTK